MWANDRKRFAVLSEQREAQTSALIFHNFQFIGNCEKLRQISCAATAVQLRKTKFSEVWALGGAAKQEK